MERLEQSEVGVLIAEDDYLVGEMIKGVLIERNYTIAGEAATGLEAVKLTQEIEPDVVLMDIKMPDMDGIEATRQICQLCPTPVVILTAYETAELVEQASQAGAGAYLVKPPNPQEMERAIIIAIARFQDMMTLRRLNKELMNRNEELDAFAHMVSYDLQNSVSLIISHADSVRDQIRMSEKLQEHIMAIIRNGHKMGNIINEMQLLAGLRTEEVRLRSLNMGRIVAEAQQRLSGLIEEYQAEISFPEYWPQAVGYAPWVEEVWANYLSNAIQYGGQPPRIQLGATICSGGTVRFWVRDNGPGLTAEERQYLFKPAALPNSNHRKGYGLGLSIVRRIVEKLGGKTGAESEAGRGSLFYFTLPAR